MNHSFLPAVQAERPLSSLHLYYDIPGIACPNLDPTVTLSTSQPICPTLQASFAQYCAAQQMQAPQEAQASLLRLKSGRMVTYSPVDQEALSQVRLILSGVQGRLHETLTLNETLHPTTHRPRMRSLCCSCWPYRQRSRRCTAGSVGTRSGC